MLKLASSCVTHTFLIFFAEFSLPDRGCQAVFWYVCSHVLPRHHTSPHVTTGCATPKVTFSNGLSRIEPTNTSGDFLANIWVHSWLSGILGGAAFGPVQAVWLILYLRWHFELKLQQATWAFSPKVAGKMS